jgi:RHS repeat-associated protein
MKSNCSTDLPRQSARRPGRLPELLDHSGDALVDVLVYDGFGNSLAEEEEAHRFSYQPLASMDDPMMAVAARCYDATPGRWVEQNPVGFQGDDANLYRYVGNAPRSHLLGEDGQLHDA